MNSKIVEVRNLTRFYVSKKNGGKKFTAVDNLSFDVRKGEIFGILGPNGAGKTTTIKIISSLLAPSSGEIKVLGLSPYGEEKALRSRINSIFGGERNLYWRLTAKENLIYFADLYKVNSKIKNSRITDLLKLVGLEDVANQKVETFSKGMKQRLQIARGLINDPEILLLDEPTIGLDPIGAQELHNIIIKLSEQGKTIILTTHYMFEADKLCNRILFIDKGKKVALDTSNQLKKLLKNIMIVNFEVKNYDIYEEQLLMECPGLTNLKIKVLESCVRINMHLYQEYSRSSLNSVIRIFKDNIIYNINTVEPTLEDVYIHLIGGVLNQR